MQIVATSRFSENLKITQKIKGGIQKIKGDTQKIKGGTQKIKGGTLRFPSSTYPVCFWSDLELFPDPSLIVAKNITRAG